MDMNTRSAFGTAIKSNSRLAHKYFTTEAPAVWSVFPAGVCDPQQMKVTGWDGPFVYEIDGKTVEAFGKSVLCECSMRGFLKKVDLTEAPGSQTKKEAATPTEKRVPEVGSGLSQDGTLSHLEKRDREGIACRRWLARMVDASIVWIVYDLTCCFLMYCELIPCVAGACETVFIPLFVYFFFDAIMFGTLKTTLGRSLLGIGLERGDRKPVTFTDCLSRNFQVWMRGMWFGALCPIPMLRQYFKVKNRGETTYESKCVAHVFALPCRQVRIIVAVIMLMFIWGAREYIIKSVFPDVAFVDVRSAQKK
jgi:hypothetical protein